MTQGVERDEAQIADMKGRIIGWLEESIHGTFTQAAQVIGVSRCEAYRWRKDDPAFDSEVKRAREQAVTTGVDYVETKLMGAINENNVTAIIFYLKCLGKDRGYIDRLMMAFDKENPLQVKVTHEIAREYIRGKLLSDDAEGDQGEADSPHDGRRALPAPL